MITIAILIITVAFSMYAMNNPSIKYKYIFHPYSISHNNQHYRFLSHAFLHSDYLHLAFNMYALFMFGPIVEEQVLPLLMGTALVPDKKLGMVMFMLLYTGGIYASTISEYLKNKNNTYYTSLGASGAVNALIFSFITCSPFSQLGFFFIPMPAWVFGILYLGISYFLSKRQAGNESVDRIGHEAHFWGAMFGIVFTLVLGLLNQDIYFQLIKQH